MFIDKIEIGIFDDFSFTISCSPSINVPVVSVNEISLVLLVVSATNPIAPLFNPLILEPAAVWPVAVNFKIVYVWTSYKCKSNCVEPPV